MPAVTLLQKAYGDCHAQLIEPLLRSLCKGLDVQVKVKGATVQGWIQVNVNGEDEKPTLQLLNNEFGLAPENLEKVEKFSVLRGRIMGSTAEKANELLVDVGVYQPTVVLARIPLQVLQAQIADGLALSLRRLTELYCFLDNLPITVKIVDVEKGASLWAELAESQLALYDDWLRALLDRLIIVGAAAGNVRRAVEVSRHFRDVVKVEALGLLEHAVLCKLGTDAVGLIPAIGRILRTTVMAPFSPRKISHALESLSL